MSIAGPGVRSTLKDALAEDEWPSASRRRGRERVVAGSGDRGPGKERDSVESGQDRGGGIVRAHGRRDRPEEAGAEAERRARLEDLDRRREGLHVEGATRRRRGSPPYRRGRSRRCSPLPSKKKDSTENAPPLTFAARPLTVAAARSGSDVPDTDVTAVPSDAPSAGVEREQPRRRDVDREERVRRRRVTRAVRRGRGEEMRAFRGDGRAGPGRAVQREDGGGRRGAGSVGDRRARQERAAEENGRLAGSRDGAGGAARHGAAVEEQRERRRRRLDPERAQDAHLVRERVRRRGGQRGRAVHGAEVDVRDAPRGPRRVEGRRERQESSAGRLDVERDDGPRAAAPVDAARDRHGRSGRAAAPRSPPRARPS